MSIGNLDILSLISTSDISSINKMTLQLKIIGQSDVKHIITLQIKTVTAVLKVPTCITTSITCRANKLSVILAILSISIYIAAVILYIYIYVLCVLGVLWHPPLPLNCQIITLCLNKQSAYFAAVCLLNVDISLQPGISLSCY